MREVLTALVVVLGVAVASGAGAMMLVAGELDDSPGLGGLGILLGLVAVALGTRAVVRGRRAAARRAGRT